MKHSPGPWQVNGEGFLVCSCGNSSEDGKDYVVTMNGYAARDGLGESDARNDACLIAAAPEMLEALKLAKGAIAIECQVTREIIEKVIAKAEGRE